STTRILESLRFMNGRLPFPQRPSLWIWRGLDLAEWSEYFRSCTRAISCQLLYEHVTGKPMPTQEHGKQQADPKKQEGKRISATIARHVLDALGQPGELHEVQVRRLWEDYFRVNVYVGADAASARVVDSFFLRADGDGNILTSTPEITKRH